MNMEAVSDPIPWEVEFYVFLKLFSFVTWAYGIFYIFIAVSALIYLGVNLGKRTIFIFMVGIFT